MLDGGWTKSAFPCGQLLANLQPLDATGRQVSKSRLPPMEQQGGFISAPVALWDGFEIGVEGRPEGATSRGCASQLILQILAGTLEFFQGCPEGEADFLSADADGHAEPIGIHAGNQTFAPPPIAHAIRPIP